LNDTIIHPLACASNLGNIFDSFFHTLHQPLLLRCLTVRRVFLLHQKQIQIPKTSPVVTILPHSMLARSVTQINELLPTFCTVSFTLW
jgi:hypothetical protein